MAGKKGMVHRKSKNNTLRERAWRSMRIMRRFTIQGVLVTCSAEEIPRKDYENIKRWVARLVVHGYVRKEAQRDLRWTGQSQMYSFVRGKPSRPLFCDVCGQPLTAGVCNPELIKKETEKEKQKEKETNTETETGTQEAI